MPSAQKIISALKEQVPITSDIVQKKIEESEKLYINAIPEGKAVDPYDNSDQIRYKMGYQAPKAYNQEDYTARPFTPGSMNARDNNNRTKGFSTQINEIDDNVCSGHQILDFAQGVETRGSVNYKINLKTNPICVTEMERMERSLVANWMEQYLMNFEKYGHENFDFALMNDIIKFGELNTSVLGLNEFNRTKGGVSAPPTNRLSMPHLRQVRLYALVEDGLNTQGELEVHCPRQDALDAIREDQLRMNPGATINTELYRDDAGPFRGRSFTVYDGIRFIFNEVPPKCYFKQVGVEGGAPRYEMVPVHPYENRIGEDGGLMKEPNHAFYKDRIVVEGVSYELCTLAFIINPKSFTRHAINKPLKPRRAGENASYNFLMEIRDGAWLNNECGDNDYNDMFKIVARHAYRLRILEPELSGVIAYRSSAPLNYVISPNASNETSGPDAFAGPAVAERTDAIIDCEVATVVGASTVNLEPVGPVTAAYTGGGSQLVLNVDRSGDFTQAGTVDFVVTAGTAVSGTDYNATNATLSWAAGEGGFKSIVIDLLTGNGTLDVTISNATGGVTLGSGTVANVTLIDLS